MQYQENLALLPIRSMDEQKTGQTPTKDPMEETKKLVNETVMIMNNNIKVLYERDAKLCEINEHAERLQDGANEFQQSSRRLKRKYWWRNLKMILILVFIAVLVVALIGLLSEHYWDSGAKSDDSHKLNDDTAGINATRL